jgi:BON domain
MRIRLSVASFGFAMYAGIAVAQTAQQPQTPPVHSSVPAARSGDATNKPEPIASPGTATPLATGSEMGGQAPETQIPASGINVVADSDLQSQIQTALSKEPTLTGDSAHVTVSGDTVELAGTVSTSKEKITATRIVQSYAGSKKLVNRLTIARRSEQNTPHANMPDTDSKLPPASSPGNAALPSQGSSTSRPPL